MYRHADPVMSRTTGQILKGTCSSNEYGLFFFLKTLFFSDRSTTLERLATAEPEGQSRVTTYGTKASAAKPPMSEVQHYISVQQYLYGMIAIDPPLCMQMSMK
jgi:hypothetical protein